MFKILYWLGASSVDCREMNRIRLREMLAQAEMGDASSVDTTKARAKSIVPSLQLAMNLLELSYIVGGEYSIGGKDYEHHINERVSWNVGQLSEHRVPRRANYDRLFYGQSGCHT